MFQRDFHAQVAIRQWTRLPRAVVESPSLEGFKKRGTSGYGLAGMAVLGWRLDLLIIEVFSNL